MKALIKKSTGEWVSVNPSINILKCMGIYPDEIQLKYISLRNPDCDFSDTELVEVVVIRKDRIPSDEEISKEFPISIHNDAYINHSHVHAKVGVRWTLDKLFNQEGKG